MGGRPVAGKNISAEKYVVTKLQGDESVSLSSKQLYDLWVSGPLRFAWNVEFLLSGQKKGSLRKGSFHWRNL